MNGDPLSHGLWEASAPPAPATQSLAGSVTVDVAVIGAGYTGLSAALHLAQGGASVAVLEAHEIGFGASGRNVGLVNAGMWVMPSALTATLGERYGGRLLRLLGDAPSVVFALARQHGIACEATQSGTLHCAVGRRGEAEVNERARQWTQLGAPVAVCDASRTRELTGTSAYRASLLDRRAGTVQPLAYARGLAGAALQSGARIFTQSVVTGAERAGARWLVRAGAGQLDAKWIVVATDAYTLPSGPWGLIRAEQVKLPYFNLATAPLPGDVVRSTLPERQGAWDTRQVLSSFRLDAAGRLVFGSVGALRGAGRRVHTDWGRRALARLFPQLDGLAFEHAWYGSIGMTADALPRFHLLDSNVVSFSGFNGRGIAPGTVFGQQIARLVLGENGTDDLPLPVTPVSPAGMRTVREFAYEAGAQLVHAVDARL